MKCFLTLVIKILLVLFVVAPVPQAIAVNNYTDWGTIQTAEDSTISFENYDISGNFVDDYAFSILSGVDTSYAVTVTIDVCKNGCGNPAITYAIYNETGALVSDTGTAVLGAGDYVFQIKGTGMGAGNEVDYFGSISFYVSAVPEPSDLQLLLSSVGVLAGIWFWKRKQKKRQEAKDGRW